ncbi:hypothetical protein DMN91_006046 [Ooceraea biroi]|uniref:Reverse transcriptase domain-containing protein n=1 Tax=Ooceraea biroi TaxID=2015173 RepID=A0A3L8DMM1_OOCBI|nr:hypothetical protein DMN91_006046 [Ooceraea biroi]
MQSSDTHGGLRGPAPLKVIHEGMDKQWQLWLQAFEFYATATQLDKKSPSIQVATFMAMLGQEALIIYNTFELADTNDIARIKELFSTKFAPKQNESYTSWLFHKLKQEALETFDEFLTKAQTMVKKCEYGGLESRMFRDKIVFGVHSDDIREKLFAEPKLDLERAILICRHAETAARQLQNMKQCDEKKIDALRKQSATTNKARLQHNKKCDPKQAKETRTGSTAKWTKHMKLDTGTNCNAMSKYLAADIGVKICPSRVKKLSAYGKYKLHVLGEAKIPCIIKERQWNLPFYIIDAHIKPSLGQTACTLTGLIKRVYSMEADKNEEDNELAEQMYQGLEPTPAVSPLVVVQQRGKIRICIDPSDLNKQILRQHYPLRTLEEVAANINGAKYFTILDCKKGFWQIPVTERTRVRHNLTWEAQLDILRMINSIYDKKEIH